MDSETIAHIWNMNKAREENPFQGEDESKKLIDHLTNTYNNQRMVCAFTSLNSEEKDAVFFSTMLLLNHRRITNASNLRGEFPVNIGCLRTSKNLKLKEIYSFGEIKKMNEEAEKNGQPLFFYKFSGARIKEESHYRNHFPTSGASSHWTVDMAITYTANYAYMITQRPTRTTLRRLIQTGQVTNGLRSGIAIPQGGFYANHNGEYETIN